MTDGLKAHTVLAENPRSVPSTDIGWLTTDYTSSSRDSGACIYTLVLILALRYSHRRAHLKPSCGKEYMTSERSPCPKSQRCSEVKPEEGSNLETPSAVAAPPH